MPVSFSRAIDPFVAPAAVPVALIFVGAQTGYTIPMFGSASNGPITGWRWYVDHPTAGAAILTSNEQNPTFDLTEWGNEEYTFRVEATNSFGTGGQATEDVTILATRDRIIFGDPAYLESELTDVRLTVPIDIARDHLDSELVSPDTVEITILADGVPVYGPNIWPWGTDLGDLTDLLGDYVFSGTLEEGGSLSFFSQGPPHVEYEVRFITQGAGSATGSVTFANPQNLIMHSRDDGENGVGSLFSTGAWQINENIANADWAAEDVREYRFCEFQGLQRSRIADPDVFGVTALDFLYNNHAPDILSLATTRYDLAWVGNDVAHHRPLEAWGSAEFPWFTADMIQQPRSGETWAEAETELANNGWSQAAINASQSAGHLGFPYQLTLDELTMKWWVRYQKMRPNYQPWIDHCAPLFKKWRLNAGDINDTPALGPRIAGYMIGPHKIQFANPHEYSDVLGGTLQGWIFNNADPVYGNPSWNIATNSGGMGIRAKWGVAEELFAEVSDHVLDTIEGSWKFAKKMSEVDPGAIILYDPLPWHIAFNSSMRNPFEAECLVRYGYDSNEARAYYVENQFAIASLPNVHYVIAREANSGVKDSVSELGQDYLTLPERNELRDLVGHRVIVYPPRYQLTLGNE